MIKENKRSGSHVLNKKGSQINILTKCTFELPHYNHTADNSDGSK